MRVPSNKIKLNLLVYNLLHLFPSLASVNGCKYFYSLGRFLKFRLYPVTAVLNNTDALLVYEPTKEATKLRLSLGPTTSRAYSLPDPVLINHKTQSIVPTVKFKIR